MNGRVKLPGWRLDRELAEKNSVFGEKSRQWLKTKIAVQIVEWNFGPRPNSFKVCTSQSLLLFILQNIGPITWAFSLS